MGICFTTKIFFSQVFSLHFTPQNLLSFRPLNECADRFSEIRTDIYEHESQTNFILPPILMMLREVKSLLQKKQSVVRVLYIMYRIMASKNESFRCGRCERENSIEMKRQVSLFRSVDGWRTRDTGQNVCRISI